MRSRINEFHYLEESNGSEHKRRIWRITELLSSANLFTEGKQMQHCVGSYASYCYRGKTTIWSMKREERDNSKRVMTIEVDPANRVILKAKGKFNHSPKKKAVEIMKKWANMEVLKIGLHI